MGKRSLFSNLLLDNLTASVIAALRTYSVIHYCSTAIRACCESRNCSEIVINTMKKIYETSYEYIEDIVNNIAPADPDKDDLIQDVALVMLEKPPEFISELYEIGRASCRERV